MFLKIITSQNDVRYELRKNIRYGKPRIKSKPETEVLLKDAVLVSNVFMNDFSVKVYELKEPIKSA